MPYSSSELDDLSHHFIKHMRASSCLDVGAGAGKYGRLIRESHPRARLVGVEAEEDYLERFELKSIYDEVRCVSAESLLETDVDSCWDLVVLGDCLEHMRKSAGVDLLNFLVYRANYLLVAFPEGYIQGQSDGYRNEAHISFWSEADFAGLDYVSMRRLRYVLVAVNGFGLKRSEPSVQEILALRTADSVTNRVGSTADGRGPAS